MAVVAAVGSFAIATPASAHGYASAPPSRQALCAQRAVADCGSITYEPQSVEAPKGAKACSGGQSQWSVLDDNSRNWPARSVGSKLQVTWTITARHRTLNWEYYVNGTKVATVDGGNAQPAAVATHSIDLNGFSGRQTILAVWNIGDTPMAFYNCIDVNVGGGGGDAGSTSPYRGQAVPGRPGDSGGAARSPAAAVVSPSARGSARGSWAPNTPYVTGDVVTYQGRKYQCRQSHTSLVSWEPSIYTLALWLPV